jgi:hypothetical protein
MPDQGYRQMMFRTAMIHGAMMLLLLRTSAMHSQVWPDVSEPTVQAGERGPQSAGGRDYYVDSKGDDSAPGTLQRPLRTISAAVEMAEAGDTVFVRRGVYGEVLTFRESGIERQALVGVALAGRNRAFFPQALSGVRPGDYLYVYESWASNNGIYEILRVEDNYVTVEGNPFVDETGHVKASIATPLKFMRYGVEQVKLDAKQSDCTSAVVNFENVDYILVDGFIVTGSCHAGVAMIEGSSHNVFRNGVIYGNDRPGVYISAAGSGRGSQYNILQANDIYQNGRQGPGEGIYIGTAYSADGSDHNHVIHNQIHDTPGGNEGTDVKDGIVGTVVEGNVYWDNHSTWGVLILGKGAAGSLVYGNIFAWSEGAQDWAGTISIYGSENQVFNNLIFRANGLDGIYLAGDPGNEVYGNIISGVDIGISIYGKEMGARSSEIIENILLWNGTQIGGDGQNYVIRGNVFGGASQEFGEDAVRVHPLLWLELTRPTSWLELYTILLHLWKNLSTPLH